MSHFSSRQQDVWVDVSLNASHRWFQTFICTYFVLAIASTAVALRSYFQQAQAYVALLLTLLLVVMILHHKSRLRTCVVKSICEFYCFECKGESVLGFVIGKNTRRVFSNYERINMQPVRSWILVLAWLVWLGYGSLFNAGQREHAENAAIENVAGAALGDSIPHVLRSARLYLLCGVALASTFLRIAGYAGAEDRWTLRLFGVFFLLMFAPTRESTAQALTPLEIVARVSSFCALLLVSETHRRTLHYVDWLQNFDQRTSVVLAGIQMSLGKAKPRSLRGGHTRDTLVASIADQVPLAGRSFSFVKALGEWSVVVESAWVLAASNGVYGLTLAQLAATCVSIGYHRRRIAQFVDAHRSALVRRRVDPGTGDEPIIASANAGRPDRAPRQEQRRCSSPPLSTDPAPAASTTTTTAFARDYREVPMFPPPEPSHPPPQLSSVLAALPLSLAPAAPKNHIISFDELKQPTRPATSPSPVAMLDDAPAPPLRRQSGSASPEMRRSLTLPVSPGPVAPPIRRNTASQRRAELAALKALQTAIPLS